MNRATKAFNWAFWPVVFGMGVALLVINLYSRFAYECEAGVFYSRTADMTCLTTTVHGQAVIWCEPGDNRPADEVFP